VESSPTLRERNMAALAQSLGTLTALPVWLRWRNRSTFVRAHAAQSLRFDAITLAAMLAMAALSIGMILALNAGLAALPGEAAMLMRLAMLMVCAPGLPLMGCLVIMITALVLRTRATMAANAGKLFRYPLPGKKILGAGISQLT